MYIVMLRVNFVIALSTSRNEFSEKTKYQGKSIKLNIQIGCIK